MYVLSMELPHTALLDLCFRVIKSPDYTQKLTAASTIAATSEWQLATVWWCSAAQQAIESQM